MATLRDLIKAADENGVSLDSVLTVGTANGISRYEQTGYIVLGEIVTKKVEGGDPAYVLYNEILRFDIGLVCKGI